MNLQMFSLVVYLDYLNGTGAFYYPLLSWSFIYFTFLAVQGICVWDLHLCDCILFYVMIYRTFLLKIFFKLPIIALNDSKAVTYKLIIFIPSQFFSPLVVAIVKLRYECICCLYKICHTKILFAYQFIQHLFPKKN